jgi:hypothetical protein
MDLMLVPMVMVILAILGLAAVTEGVDSRDESSDPRRPAYPVGID